MSSVAGYWAKSLSTLATTAAMDANVMQTHVRKDTRRKGVFYSYDTRQRCPDLDG